MAFRHDLALCWGMYTVGTQKQLRFPSCHVATTALAAPKPVHYTEKHLWSVCLLRVFQGWVSFLVMSWDSAHFSQTWKPEMESEAKQLKKKNQTLKSVFAIRLDRKACTLNRVLWKGPGEVKKEDYNKNRISKTLHIENKDRSIHFQSYN